MASYLATSLLLLQSVSAAAVARSKDFHTNGKCRQFDLSITAEAPGSVFDIPEVVDDITTVNWAVMDDRWSNKGGIRENITISGTYNINAQLCVPDGATPKNVLQIATHGAHYDGRYWDSEYKPEEHSYVYAALAAGYSILTYDRLGAGKSDIPDAYTGVQTGLEMEILRQITQKAREGTLNPSEGESDPDIFTKASKIVHIGHSYGTAITWGFLATYPGESEGGILTGFVLNAHSGDTGRSSWCARYAATADPAWDRPSGYIVNTKTGIQTSFFGGDPATAFTPELLEIGNDLKQPVAVGELASSGQVIGLPGPNTKIPIQYVLAERDFLVCGGDCNGVTNLTVLQQFWPAATDIDMFVQPNTGHALPLHNNATAGFQLSFAFLERNGL